MDQSDLAFIHRKETPTSLERAKIPFEVMNKLQTEELPVAMAPEEIQEQIIPGQSSLVEALVERYFEKYITPDFNGIQAYCEDKDADPELLLRLQQGTHTKDDLKILGSFIELAVPDGVFFEDNTEIKAFLDQYNKH